MNKLLEIVNNEYQKNFSTITTYSPKTYIIDDQYILKKTNKKMAYILSTISKSHIESLVPLIYTANNDSIIHFENQLYYLMNKLKIVDYPYEQKLVDYYHDLHTLHHNTYQPIKIDKKITFRKFYQIFKNLDSRFKHLEAFIKLIESKEENYTEYDLLFLSNYYHFLDAKKIMYDIQKRLHNFIDTESEIMYAIIHTHPDVNHYLSGKGNYIISFEKAKRGIEAVDIYRFYLLNDDGKININQLVKNWLTDLEKPFYFDYFLFMTYYTYIILLNLDPKNWRNSLEIFMYVVNKLKKIKQLALYQYNKEKSSQSV